MQARESIAAGGVPRVVIVGGGFAGLWAARALAHAPVEVVLLDRRNHHLFQPLLYQVATAALSPGDIATPIRHELRRQKNAQVSLAEAQSVDLDGRVVRTEIGDFPYDYLILAPGAGHSYFGHDEWESHAPGLKTIDDALEIRRRILLAFEDAENAESEERRRALLTFVIVGGGPTGVELAGAIAEISRQTLVDDFREIDPARARILLVEAGPRIMAAFPESLSASAVQQLSDLGVEVRTGVPVTAISDGEVTLGDQTIQAGTILWAAGVKASPLLESLGVELDRAGRVTVAPDLTLPGYQEVYVVGDASVFPHRGKRPLPGVAPVAMQQGSAAARNIERTMSGRPRRQFRYIPRGNWATIGRAAAIVHLGPLKLSGLPAWLLWLAAHIFFLVGFGNRVVVLTRWAWAYLWFQRGARLITGGRRR